LEKNCRRINRRRIVETFGECRPSALFSFPCGVLAYSARIGVGVNDCSIRPNTIFSSNISLVSKLIETWEKLPVHIQREEKKSVVKKNQRNNIIFLKEIDQKNLKKSDKVD
jgi:hypothetical protein